MASAQHPFDAFGFASERLATDVLLPSDADVLLHMYSDAEAMRYRGSAPMRTLADARQQVAQQRQSKPDGASRRLALRLRDDHTLVGTLLLRSTAEEPGMVDIGFSFGRSHWRKGYAFETLLAVEAAFRQAHQIHTIKAWVVRENRASKALFEKAGYATAEQSVHPGSLLFVKQVCP